MSHICFSLSNNSRHLWLCNAGRPICQQLLYAIERVKPRYEKEQQKASMSPAQRSLHTRKFHMLTSMSALQETAAQVTEISSHLPLHEQFFPCERILWMCVMLLGSKVSHLFFNYYITWHQRQALLFECVCIYVAKKHLPVSCQFDPRYLSDCPLFIYWWQQSL